MQNDAQQTPFFIFFHCFALTCAFQSTAPQWPADSAVTLLQTDLRT